MPKAGRLQRRIPRQLSDLRKRGVLYCRLVAHRRSQRARGRLQRLLDVFEPTNALLRLGVWKRQVPNLQANVRVGRMQRVHSRTIDLVLPVHDDS